MLALLFALAAFLLAGMAWSSNKALTQNMNRLLVRIDRLERSRGLVQGQTWRAKIRYPGQKPIVRVVEANNEGDALRQLIVDGVKPQFVMELGPVDPPTAA